MQFLSLPQWSSGSCVPAFTSYTATGGGTAPRAWTSTIPSTARRRERRKRTRSISAGLTGWPDITTLTPDPWWAWLRSARPRAHPSSLYLWEPDYRIQPHTGTQSSPPSRVLNEEEEEENSRCTVTTQSTTEMWLPRCAETERAESHTESFWSALKRCTANAECLYDERVEIW